MACVRARDRFAANVRRGIVLAVFLAGVASHTSLTATRLMSRAKTYAATTRASSSVISSPYLERDGGLEALRHLRAGPYEPARFSHHASS